MSGGYTWLGVAIVIGSMISLGYYLPVIAAMWMREAPSAAAPAPAGTLPAVAGGSPELDGEDASGEAKARPAAGAGRQPEVVLLAVLAGAATIFFGLLPQPLFDLLHGAGSALGLT